MKKLILVSVLLVLPMFSHSQNENDDYYRLSKEGKKYLKPIKFVLLDDYEKKIKDASTVIFFNIGSEIFEHNRNRHELDTLSASDLKTIQFVSIKQLKNDEFKEHKKRTKQEGINIPPPFNHYNLKIF